MPYLVLDSLVPSVRWLGSICIASSLLGGCEDADSGGDDSADGHSPDGPDVSELDDPLYEAKVVYSEAWCSCYWEAGEFADQQDCSARHPGAVTDACEADVLFGNDAALPRIECLFAAAQAEAACVREQMCGDQTSVVSMCAKQEMDALGACPDYPNEVTASLDACYEPEPFWMVADDGMIFGINGEGTGRTEPRTTGSDLHAIVCDGAARAWIVGEEGTVLRTETAGLHWETGHAPTQAALRAVAQRDGRDLAAAGDAGAFLLSDDGGASWAAVDAPVRDFTGVAATVDAAWLLSDRRGTVWRYAADTGFDEVHVHPDGPLFAIASDHHSPNAAAVGASGTVLQSGDAGQTWVSRTTPTGEDLRAVNVLGHDAILAAGDGGVVVRLDDARASLTLASTDQHSIRGLHVTSSGTGAAVGDSGTFLRTRDGGEHWHAIDLGIDADLSGLDQPFHAH